jgi:SAM-dependent methyltransferase
MARETYTYTPDFYEGHRDASLSSARRIVPLLRQWVPSFRSVIDVGCGVGTWLRAFKENGVEDLLGIDGAYVHVNQLEISREQFRPFDLRERVKIERRFDLAMSVEVAEHLPPSCADGFVESLTELAPVVLFSAAVPHQEGENHLNEQWQAYWAERFDQRGFVAIDCIRPRVWNDDAVSYWYAQNALLYCRRDHLDTLPALKALADATDPAFFSIVHPKAYLTGLARMRERLTNATDPQRISVRGILPTFAAVLKNALGRRARSMVKR